MKPDEIAQFMRHKGRFTNEKIVAKKIKVASATKERHNLNKLEKQ